MDLADSRPGPTLGYAFPNAVRTPSSSRRASQVPDESFDTRCPHPPRRAWWLHLLVASPPMAGFALSDRLATRNLRNEAESGSRQLRLMSSPWEASALGLLLTPLPRLHVERAIYMAGSFQPTRLTRPDRPRKASRTVVSWRTRARRGAENRGA